MRWSRFHGSNENTNGLLRQYFPRSTDLSVYSPAHLNRVALHADRRWDAFLRKMVLVD